MLTKKKILSLLEKDKSYLKSRYHIRKIGIFGSYAIHRQKKGSDVDIFVEFSKPVDFEFFDMAAHLENLLGKKVDIITPAGLKSIRVPRVARSIAKSVAYA